MIARASGFGMGVGRFSRPLRGVGVQAMPDASLHTKQCIESAYEVPPSAGVLQLLVSGVVVRVFIDRSCVVDRVEVTHSVISATPALFSEDEGVEF